eukprot:TRINITY_DN9712_c0_g1_i1.p1 TRINITY_DN9712_c0_g1~~TRINITY_DN9712_c0_g1_i1.p1  ORF type:complete len:174 (+),score=26.33 TRINITY_DN9712_c0_g1_i1:103-624(+)
MNNNVTLPLVVVQQLLHNQLMLANQFHNQPLIEQLMQLLGEKMWKSLRSVQLPSNRRYVAITMSWAENSRNDLIRITIPWGIVEQPLPHFRPNSPVTIIRIDAMIGIETLFPSWIRKNFRMGQYTQVCPPLWLKWSTTTNKVTIIFSWKAYLPSGQLVKCRLNRTLKGQTKSP